MGRRGGKGGQKWRGAGDYDKRGVKIVRGQDHMSVTSSVPC